MSAANPLPTTSPQELDLLRDSAASFCQREAPASRIKGMRSSGKGYDLDIYRQIADLGWLGLLIDEQAGGLGLDLASMAVIVRETGKQAVAEPVIEVGVLSAVTLNELWSSNQSAKALCEQIAAGESIVVTAAEQYTTEGTTGVPQATSEGDLFRLSGTATCVPFAAEATAVIVPAMLDGDFVLLNVDPSTDGIARRDRDLADGSTHAHLSFDGCALPGAALLARGDDAATALDKGIEYGHLASASYLVGLLTQCFETTLDYLRTRVQFDQPIGGFQALQHRAVDLFVQRELATAVVDEAIRNAAQAKDLDALRFAASRARYRAIEASRLITREAIQMHGAIGFTYECDIGHYLNRALVLAARGGNAAWHRQRIGALANAHDPAAEALDRAAIGKADPDDWNDLSDDAFRAVVRDWFEREYPSEMRNPPRRFRWAEIKDWYIKLSERGWVAPNWPAEFGGMGLSPSKMLVFIEEQERWGIGRAPDMGILMIGPLLIQHGTPEQQAYYLPKILAGEHVWCQGYSEPNAGSDLASLKTSAVSAGDNFVVNGQKTWTTLAQDATHMFLLVRTSSEGRKQAGISFLLVDINTPGISIRPIRNLAGDEEFCEVFFDDVAVPKSNIVGELNAGWTMAKALLSFERLFIGSPKYSQYTLQRLDEVIAARGLSGNQALMERTTGLRADVLDLESVYLKFAEIVKKGGVLGADVSLLKIWATETFARLTELLIEASDGHGAELGPIPFADIKANAMGQFYNARPATIYGGSNEIQRNIIAKHVLALPG